ncbi:hypothetical protein OS122_02465 [Mycolicibacterium mucogenicum]|uniref:phage fiber-tail adaptor protein n=1 Tax=Mycolicibacterium mucogenicum TaxID=56689 RepID=UPI002269868C|nr:hypothetical protein [Mycolicibacterium mucogenicum]MCX8559762.1 hypothetical protein [Mycolicibacterium mucogenicum]
MSTIGTQVKDPGDITPVTADWVDFLALTEDTILDCDALPDPGIKIEDCWFTDTDTTAKVSGGINGMSYGVTFLIYTQGDEQYKRTIKIRCKNQ